MNVTITRLAAANRVATKVAAKAVLKAAGLKQTLADDFLAEVARLNVLRDAKTRTKMSLRRPSGRAPVCLKDGTPATRLDALRCATVKRAYVRTYRTAANGSLDAALTRTPDAVGVVQVESIDWNLYRGAHKGKPARVQDTTITVPADWRVRVAGRGLAVVDGMMTLDAAPVETSGCELFAAAWAVQGRGTSVTVQRGYIARSGSLAYHGATIDQALSGIARKCRALAVTAMLAAADLGELVATAGDLRVTISDAKLIGACDYGIRSWCAAVGLDYEVGAASIAAVYAAYQREPRSEARAAILHALRRARKLIPA